MRSDKSPKPEGDRPTHLLQVGLAFRKRPQPIEDFHHGILLAWLLCAIAACAVLKK
jgi:hypothetical protein